MAAPKRIRFSKRSVDALKRKRKRYFVYDVTTANLCVCVSPVGTRTFYRYGRIDGRPVRYRLGAYPEMSVQQARKVCAKVTSDVLDGRNPQHERQEQRKSMTLGALFDDYLARHAKIHKKTWQQDRNQFDAYMPTLKGRRICDIRRRGVARLHAAIGQDHGHYAANRLLLLLSRIFAFGIDNDHIDANPARGIRRFPEESRDRFLDAEEMRSFLEALDDEPELYHDFIATLVFVGARKGNVQTMRWDELRLASGTWRIPETKIGESQTVHLPPVIVEILERRNAESRSEWVFPSVRSPCSHC